VIVVGRLPPPPPRIATRVLVAVLNFTVDVLDWLAEHIDSFITKLTKET
jgi:hypothetical protein